MLLIGLQSFAQGLKRKEAFKVGDFVDEIVLIDQNNQTKNYSASTLDTPHLALIFWNKSCPYAVAYQERINALAKKYSTLGVKFLWVNPQYSADDHGAMIVAQCKDPDNTVCHNFAIKKQPIICVLTKNNQKLQLKYCGGIDDNAQSEADVKVKYVETVLNDLLLGREPNFTNVKPLGCGIGLRNI